MRLKILSIHSIHFLFSDKKTRETSNSNQDISIKIKNAAPDLDWNCCPNQSINGNTSWNPKNHSSNMWATSNNTVTKK